MRKLLLCSIFLFASIITYSQKLGLNDLIKLHSSSRVLMTQFLKSKDPMWTYNTPEYRGSWMFDNGADATFIRKPEDDSELIIITNNKTVINTIYNDIEKFGMKRDGDREVYIGKNWVVGFKSETNKSGELISSIHLIPKSLFN